MASCSSSRSVPELSTHRLRLGAVTEDDAELILAVLTDPDFIRFVGDRGVKNQDQARTYIKDRMLPSFFEHGFGMYRLESKDSGQVLGICGLVNRPELDQPDLGFTLLPSGRGAGLAAEASHAVLKDARQRLGLQQILAITDPHNLASIKVLENLGFTLKEKRRLFPNEEMLNLFELRL